MLLAVITPAAPRFSGGDRGLFSKEKGEQGIIQSQGLPMASVSGVCLGAASVLGYCPSGPDAEHVSKPVIL